MVDPDSHTRGRSYPRHHLPKRIGNTLCRTTGHDHRLAGCEEKFLGKGALDFSSNLGGAVPGTILGIGFIMAFNKPSISLAIVIYAMLALFFAQIVGKNAASES